MHTWATTLYAPRRLIGLPPERRAAGIGIVMTAFAVAAASGVPGGLQLAHVWGWRMPFLVVAAVGILLTSTVSVVIEGVNLL